jgi:hypothetical protein
MKQIWPNYSYSPTTNVLTLTGLNIDRDQLLLVTAADRGRIMYNFADSSVTASAFTSGANTALTLVATTAGLTTTASLVIYYDDQVASNSVTGTVELGPTSLNALESITVTMGQVTVTGGLTDTQLRASAVTIGGTVTANLNSQIYGQSTNAYAIRSAVAYYNGGDLVDVADLNPFPVTLVNSSGASFFGTSGNPLNISGTVTIGSALPTGTNRIGVVTIGGGTVTIGAGTSQIGSVTASISNSLTISSLPAISGTVTAMAGTNFRTAIQDGILDYVSSENFPVNIGSPLPAGTNQIGSVTANSSNGYLTTRFGSVTTANTAFATSAVTNANRKYLLIQNITTAANVITVGIGFTPTTTQGIQLFAGAGLTFEGSYIPTGSVNLLSSVTASCYTILEA